MGSLGGRLPFGRFNAVDRIDTRVGAFAAIASGAWVAQSLASLALFDPTSVLDVTMIAPMLLTVTGVWLLRRQGAFGHGVLSRVLAGFVTVAALGVIPGQLAFAFAWDGPAAFFAIAGTAAFIGSIVLAGVAMLRARVLPRWMGVSLIVAQPLAILLGVVFSPISPLADHGDYTGALGHGIVWGLIAAALLGKRIPILNEQPARMFTPAKA